VTDLNDANKPFTASTNSFEMKGMNTFFGNFMTEISPITDPGQQSKFMTYNQTSALPSVPNTPDEAQISSLNFDGSKSKGVGAGCVLIDLAGNTIFISFRLEFKCTNNIIEYEALLQGIRKALDMDVHNLMVFGDSKIMVRQVRNSIHCLSPHLKIYQTEVWSLMQKFPAFNINSIPRLSNSEAGLLANVTSKLFPTEGLSPNVFLIKLLFRMSIPNNITNWRVFDDDQQIINFLHMEDIFQGEIIDEGTHNENLRNFTVISDPRSPKSTSDLINSIPRSIVRLEIFYDLHDKFRGSVNCKMNSSSLIYETVNLGTKENPPNINLGMGCSEQERFAFIKLFKEFKDIFSWTYDDLKTFDPNIIEHVIPMKSQTQPF
jgi:ribonuclease HI